MKAGIKKFISVLLMIAFAFSFIAFPVQAVNTEKIAGDLQSTIKEMAEGEKTDVYIMNEVGIGYEEIQQELKEMGLVGPVTPDSEGVQQYLALRNRLLMEIYERPTRELCALLEVPDEDNLAINRSYAHWRLTAEQIALASEQEYVLILQGHDFDFDEPPLDLDDEPAVDDTTKYRTRLDEWLKEEYDETGFLELSEYEELYEHKTVDGAVDWVLIHAEIGLTIPWNACCLFGNRVLIRSTREVFEFGYGLYDARDDRFYDLTVMKDYASYSGLEKAVELYVKEGRLLGDLDNNGEIEIVDVTLLQRCEAGIREYPESDLIDLHHNIAFYYTSQPTYYSDFNRDGERDIIDATCIQRYMAGLPYPIAS